MSGMEFSWRMVAALAWPLVVFAVLIVYRKWITETFTSLTLRFGSVEIALNRKVDTTGKDIASALRRMRGTSADGDSPNLVDLMPEVSRNIGKCIQAAFGRVQEALEKYYPQFRGLPQSQILQTADDLKNNGLLDKDVAASVTKLYELLEMPQWNSDRAGDTRGYAFLMLAEGAIQGIIRSSKVHSQGPFAPPA